ncbi:MULTISPECIES: alpha/beta hydrolase [unclassified Solwaraspora]|uniref:alpha/beta hydrolase n=1 Tax=unclassified Solwaraspora TaxID=2627926 RepID=UPI00259BBEAA|nr:alpha/beta hydrolase [Solwaraspora sp. WMMA2056]WJK42140.1 alpha/beta hydrolase [Solwaraspora sp. WMMA2056]
MATFVLIPGGGTDPWYWHRLVDELRRRGHEAVPVDLPCEDDGAGWAEYADAVVTAIGGRTDVVLVAHSLAGFTAPLVADRLPVRLLVLLTAMVPVPGETGGDWWANTGHAAALAAQAVRDGRPAGEDVLALFLDGVPDELAAQVLRHDRAQSGTPFGQPWPLPAWPDVPTRFVLCRDDRFFPAEFVRRFVDDRLGIVPDGIDGGHLAALTHPRELADQLTAYLR